MIDTTRAIVFEQQIDLWISLRAQRLRFIPLNERGLQLCLDIFSSSNESEKMHFSHIHSEEEEATQKIYRRKNKVTYV